MHQRSLFLMLTHVLAIVFVPAVANRAFAAGVREMMMLMPDAYTRYQGSMYSASLATGDWENFIARELALDGWLRDAPNRDETS
jgi:hypothetical protein